MNSKYDTLVFIGRFQPFHNGHKRVIDRAFDLADNVLVLVGSSNRSRSERNPFTFQERSDMIESVYQPFNNTVADSNGESSRLTIRPLNDFMYDDEGWIQQVQQIVSDNTNTDDTIGLIGCAKDESSFYLKLFPTWDSEEVNFLNPINATDLRNQYFTYNTRKHWVDNAVSIQSFVEESVPEAVFDFLKEFPEDTYQQLKAEKDFNVQYKKSVQKYDRIEHTVDTVVVQSGHVLLIRRRSEPGRGQWALPGGFLNVNERMVDGAIRELREETKIKVPEALLRGSIKASKPFDDPHRSERGRLITQAFLIKLPDQTFLPKVKGSDDADAANWVPLSEINPLDLFEDHYFIIQDMIGEL